MEVTLDAVTFHYQKKSPAVLQALSVTLLPGVATALIGRSGTGKSTLLQVLKGLLRPTSGAVRLGGCDPWRERQLDRFDAIGYLFQSPEHQLFARTVYEDIAFGPRQRFPRDEDKVRSLVRNAMQRAGVPEQAAERSPFELSGGEKRRVALAGVLALEPQVLLLDEPTAGLDARGRADLFATLDQLRADGLPLLLVTHRLDDVLAQTSRVLVLGGGRLLRDGHPADVLADTDFLHAHDLLPPDALTFAAHLRHSTGLDLPRPWDLAATADALVVARHRSCPATDGQPSDGPCDSDRLGNLLR